MAYDSFLASIIQPMVPYNQGLHQAGAGMSDVADFLAKQKQEEAQRQLELQRMDQQRQQAAAQNGVAMLNAQNTGRYHDEMIAQRQAADALRVKAEQDARVNKLRDALGVARRNGDAQTQALIHAELARTAGWQITEEGAPPGLPTGNPGGLPAAAPATAPKGIVLGDQVIGNEPQDLGDVDDPAFLKPAETEPGLATPEEMRAAQALPVPGAPLPPAPTGLREKLSPAAQAQLDVTSKELGISTDTMLKMMQQESGLNPRADNGLGNTGLWQLNKKSAEALIGPGRRLADLPDNEQIALYPKYTAGRPIKSDVDVMVNQLAPARLGKIDTSDPNAVLYSAEETAKWSAEHRKANGALLNPDGSMTVGSASRGYLHSDANGGGSPPSPLGATPGGNPGGLPPATTPGRGGGVYTYRDREGNLIERYDGAAENERTKSLLQDAISPLMGDGSDPRAKAAAEKAVAFGTRAFGVMGPEKAIEQARQVYQAEMSRKAPGASGENREERLRLQGGGNAVSSIYSKVASAERYGNIPVLEQSANSGLDLLNGARSGFTDTVALKSLVKSLNGAAASDREYSGLLNANGVWERIERNINSVTDGGKLPDDLMKDLETVLTNTLQNARQRRMEAATAAENLAEGSLLTMNPQERAQAKAQLRKMFVPGEDGAPAKPAERSGVTPSATTGADVGAAGSDATKAAIERARKLLGM